MSSSSSSSTIGHNHSKDNDNNNDDNDLLITALRRIDPLLCFLTRATGQAWVPLPTLHRALPNAWDATGLLRNVQELTELGLLQLQYSNHSNATLSWDNADCRIGFPPPPTAATTATLTSSETTAASRGNNAPLHGSTKTAAKRRLAALKRVLKQKAKAVNNNNTVKASSTTTTTITRHEEDEYKKLPSIEGGDQDDKEKKEEESTVLKEEERQAREALVKLFAFAEKNATLNKKESDGGDDDDDTEHYNAIPTCILPQQASYAGSHPAQDSAYAELSPECQQMIPAALLKAFGLSRDASLLQQQPPKKLYRHQALAIEAALQGTHCTICTGTGSGKSLCFLLPVLTAAYNHNQTSLILFPTKALAQDQLSKLEAILSSCSSSDDNDDDNDLAERIRPATLDGDCPHATRAHVAQHANVILTNPDTLHAAILPSWRTSSNHYASLLSRLAFCVIDEAHLYKGILGAHVCMILSRLVRVQRAAAAAATEQPSSRNVTFLATSATLPFPEQHFRLLCPIDVVVANAANNDNDNSNGNIKVLSSKQDGSPRSAKHFFVWNPPLVQADGRSTGKVCLTTNKQRRKGHHCPNTHGGSVLNKKSRGTKRPREENDETLMDEPPLAQTQPLAVSPEEGDEQQQQQQRAASLHRRHAADETALLLARAVVNGVRCIVFCKTRNLVEWVFERALAVLQKNPGTAHLASRIESYRGGYSMTERRKIEQRLFRNELLGVVGTNALELGIDLGGIDLTLHCGYPTSYESLLQQAGRSGRDRHRLDVPSVAVVVCFNSPSEQHLWRHPLSLLGKGVSAPNSIPINSGLVQSHLICASNEFPLTGEHPMTAILDANDDMSILNDCDLFGGKDIYDEAIAELQSNGSVVGESVATPASGSNMTVFKAHPSMRKAWTRVSIRSIEPVTYAIVDVSHPAQGGRMDGIYDEQAVMDTLPYSRVFYHAHPGAIITHRGRKFKVISMTRPPAFIPDNYSYRRSHNLAAFAKPTTVKYSTRPLSNHFITVIKPMERVELLEKQSKISGDDETSTVDEGANDKDVTCTFAGCGAVSVKRTVHGYKKLSLITRVELSRSELELPPLEFDTFGLWLDANADGLSTVLGDKYGPGVHALSHALLAVAPIYAPGVVRADLECDHSFFAPTQVMLFDERAGGSGACQQLWKLFFQPNSILEAAIRLLEECSLCAIDSVYDGGCPACLYAPNCIKFNMHMSRSAGVVVAKRMLDRIKRTELYKRNVLRSKNERDAATPRRKARQRALRNAKEMHPARSRQFVVGRPSWPLDGDEVQGRQIHGD